MLLPLQDSSPQLMFPTSFYNRAWGEVVMPWVSSIFSSPPFQTVRNRYIFPLLFLTANGQRGYPLSLVHVSSSPFKTVRYS